MLNESSNQKKYYTTEDEYTLRQALAEKDREIERLNLRYAEALMKEANRSHMEYEAYHALMAKAVEFAENTIYIMGALCSNRHELESNGHVLKSRAFLASPEVRTWREQEGL